MKGLALLLLLLVPSAAAHAVPFASEPAGGARLETAPTEVWVDFTEPVFDEGTWLRVFDQTGTRVDQDDVRISGPTTNPRLTVSLDDIGDGAYRIEWQTYSKSDGHTINGAIGFAVGGFAPPATTTDAETAFDIRSSIARGLLYAGFAAALGALVYVRFVGPASGAARQVRIGSVAALVGTAALTLDTWSGTGIGLADYLTSPGGTGLSIRVLAVALLTAWAWKSQGGWLLFGWLAFAALTASKGHITSHGAWGLILEWLHLVAMAAWLGGLWLFLRNIGTPEHGPKFTRLAQWAVASLVLTGTIISAFLVADVITDPDTLWSDSWTWFLSAKLVLVAIMLLLAAVNRWVFMADHPLRRLVARWRPDWTATGEARARGLRRTVRFEAGISALVIVTAGLLMSVSPPTEGTIQTAAGLERTAQGDDYLGLLEVRPQPQVGGSHTVRVYLTEEATGEVLANNTCGRDSCVRLRWDVDGASQQETVLVPEGDGWWRGDDVLLIASGNTTFELDVQSAYVYRDTLRFAPFLV